uniref:Uncharacterized protein n=1 Tax=viral metagenome TaxID=1070528 RepID=A0A6C0ELR2_9ZZZZ
MSHPELDTEISARCGCVKRIFVVGKQTVSCYDAEERIEYTYCPRHQKLFDGIFTEKNQLARQIHELDREEKLIHIDLFTK